MRNLRRWSLGVVLFGAACVDAPTRPPSTATTDEREPPGLGVSIDDGLPDDGLMRSYDCRRAERFRGKLSSALRVLARGDLSVDAMFGAWAGEIGQIHFLPLS